jgi:hypothetical protein
MYRKAMRGISHYSCSYLKQQKPSVLLINIYNLSSTKLEIRAEQFLLRGGGWGEREKGRRGGRGERQPRFCMLIRIKEILKRIKIKINKYWPRTKKKKKERKEKKINLRRELN